jgi:hypothetical protein
MKTVYSSDVFWTTLRTWDLARATGVLLGYLKRRVSVRSGLAFFPAPEGGGEIDLTGYGNPAKILGIIRRVVRDLSVAIIKLSSGSRSTCEFMVQMTVSTL